MATDYEEEELFRAIAESGARALLIGDRARGTSFALSVRRALAALGLPVLSADYDLWIHGDDIAALNAGLEPLDLHRNRPPDEARRRGRYVLEGHKQIDVLVARQVSTKDGVPLCFEDAWARRRTITYAPKVPLQVPGPDDMMLIKQGSPDGRGRPRDARRA